VIEVKAEKIGKITVIRLKRKGHRPQRKFCTKRLFYKIKGFFHPESETISWKKVVEIIKEFIGDYQFYLLLADEYYRILPFEQMIQLIKKDDTKQLEYHPNTFDCDNFSLCSSSKLSLLTYPLGICYGELWYYSKSKNYAHAINLFVCRQKEKLILLCHEPQNGEIFAYDKKDWQCMMVKIC